MGQCDRRAVLERAGVEGKPLDDETLRKFWIGEVLHSAIQKVMSEDSEAGVLGHEVPVRDEEYRVSGRADTLSRTGEGVEVIEYKTIDSKAYRYGDLPYGSHIQQVAHYLTFPSEYGLPVRARIAYIGKQDGRIEEFMVEADDDLRDAVRTNLVRLQDLLEKYRSAGEMPPPLEAPKTDYRIRFCDYKGTGLCCGDEEWQTAARTDATAANTSASIPSSSDARPMAA